MFAKTLTAGLLSAALLSSAAYAQNPAPSATSPSPAASSSSSASMSHQGQWRSSKLIGVNVYNANNESLGEINELLLDQSGKIQAAVIGVGGFLGMGQRDIKVEMSKLKFVDEPMKTSSTTTTTTGAANRPAATTTTTTTADHKWYPDHAVLAGATKDQLKGMPEFKYN